MNMLSSPLECSNFFDLILYHEYILNISWEVTALGTVVAVWPGNIPPWLFWRGWCHGEERPGGLWHQTPSSPPSERSRMLEERAMVWTWQSQIVHTVLLFWALPRVPDPSSPIMWPQPPQPICEPSGLTNLQLEPVPDINTTPPAEKKRENRQSDLYYMRLTTTASISSSHKVRDHPLYVKLENIHCMYCHFYSATPSEGNIQVIFHFYEFLSNVNCSLQQNIFINTW